MEDFKRRYAFVNWYTKRELIGHNKKGKAITISKYFKHKFCVDLARIFFLIEYHPRA